LLEKQQYKQSEEEIVMSNLLDLVVSQCAYDVQSSPQVDVVKQESLVVVGEDALTNGSTITASKPFFTSKLTNSQLSEELLNEIGVK
jgi:hypothetical protein